MDKTEVVNITTPGEDVGILTEIDVDESFELLPAKLQRVSHLWLSGAYSVPKIAALLHVQPATVRKWLKSPVVKSAINTYQMEEHDLVMQRIKSLNMKAIEKLDELLDSEIDGIKYQAVRDVLDRTGHKATTKQEIDVNIRTYEQSMKELVGAIENPNEFIDGDFTVNNE